MGGVANKLQNTADGAAQDFGATMTIISNTVGDLQRDTSGTVANVANECIGSLRIIVQETERTTHLITNGFYAITLAIIFSIFLYITQTPSFIRIIVWMMYTSLCLHMLMTYIRYSRSPITTNQYQNQQLEQIITQSKNPLELILTGYKLSYEDMRTVIIQAFYKQQCINLKLVGCQITKNGADILADVLFSNKTLIQLSLWNNQLGDKGVQYLSNALSANENSLRKLDLSQNGITDEGANYLAQMLKTNRMLTHLSLSNNRITDHGVQSLADALEKRNTTLEILSLTENKLITDKSIHFLAHMCKHNRSLKKLWINDCNLSKISKTRLKLAARKHIELTT